jgi:hypothetical protein
MWKYIMNKWENSSKHNDQCHCTNSQGLFIPGRQLSFVVAGLLFLFFFVFMTGYFLGKKNVVEQFSDQIHQEAFADQIYTSVIANMIEGGSSTNPASPELLAEAHMPMVDELVEIAHNNETSHASEHAAIALPIIDTIEHEPSMPPHYYAQLIGFGTEKAAQQFVKKLAGKGIESDVKKRTSKTAKGRTSYWYQVVTGTHTNKNELIALVDRIAKEENIKGAQIRTC